MVTWELNSNNRRIINKLNKFSGGEGPIREGFAGHLKPCQAVGMLCARQNRKDLNEAHHISRVSAQFRTLLGRGADGAIVDHPKRAGAPGAPVDRGVRAPSGATGERLRWRTCQTAKSRRFFAPNRPPRRLSTTKSSNRSTASIADLGLARSVRDNQTMYIKMTNPA